MKERSKEKGRKRTETERLEAKREKKGRKDRYNVRDLIFFNYGYC